jgi:AraC family transcriptional regulator
MPTMLTATTLHSGPISVIDYRCAAGPGDPSFPEQHQCYSLSYVRDGTFGYRIRGRHFEMVAGAVLLGSPGDEFVCTHDHACGDECLSFHLAPEVVETLGTGDDVWKRGALPPLAEIMVLGELAQAAVAGDSGVGLDEAGMLLAMRLQRSPARDRSSCVARRLAIVGVQSKRRSGSMRTHTSRSIWSAPRVRRG